MPRTLLRLTSSIGLAFCLSFVFTPLGCEGSYQGSYQGSVRVEPTHAAREEPQVSSGAFAAMMACVTEAKGRLTDTVYAVQFDIEVTEGGEVGKVKLHDSYPSEQALEECLGHALEGTTLPASVLQRLPKKAVSPASRGLMGQGWEELLLIGGSTSLGPISLAAAGVTVIVLAGVYVTTEAVDKYRKLRKRREKCLGMFETCVNDRPSSCKRIIQGQTTLCEICRDKCKSNQPYEQFSDECYQCGFSDPP